MNRAKQRKMEYDEQHAAMTETYLADMAQIRNEVFPVGTKVKFPIGAKQVAGVVREHPQFEWQRDRVIVVNPDSKTHATHDKHIWELELHDETRIDKATGQAGATA